ncbi:MAG: DUF4363 family protein [Clostridia bacterium]|nr:DUF4363 family protein [Clostridia bacterium]
MKRLVPAGIIFIAIIIICVISNASAYKSVNAAKNQIEEFETYYNQSNFKQAYKLALKFKKDWTKNSQKVSAYSHHCSLDDISILSAILPEAVKYRDDFEVNSAISQMKVALDTIYEEQSFTFASLY